MRKVKILNLDHPLFSPLEVDVCDSISSRLKGLMFRSELGKESGILLVESIDSRINSAIHMFFMNFDIAVIWIDKKLKVVDKKHAVRWAPVLMSSLPARYTLEINPSRLSEFLVGDQIQIKDV